MVMENLKNGHGKVPEKYFVYIVCGNPVSDVSNCDHPSATQLV